MKYLIISVLLFTSCNNESKRTTATDTNKSVNEKLETVTPDFRNYAQYISCKIDGQPYLSYSTDNNSNGISNSLNMPSQVVFDTRADQVEINGETKISEIAFSFYTLSKKQDGTLTSNGDFYVRGHTDFPESGKLKYVSFATQAGQRLMLTSVKDGILEGTFNIDVADEKDPAHILKITDGVFKMKMEGKTNLQYDKNGDVNMDSLLKSIK